MILKTKRLVFASRVRMGGTISRVAISGIRALLRGAEDVATTIKIYLQRAEYVGTDICKNGVPENYLARVNICKND